MRALTRSSASRRARGRRSKRESGSKPSWLLRDNQRVEPEPALQPAWVVENRKLNRRATGERQVVADAVHLAHAQPRPRNPRAHAREQEEVIDGLPLFRIATPREAHVSAIEPHRAEIV